MVHPICSWSLVLFGMFLPIKLLAQQKEIKHSDQQWAQYYLDAALGSKWTLLADGGYRWQRRFSQRSQYIVRVGMGYALAKNLSLRGGFAHLGYFGAESLDMLEYRPYQELSMKNALGKTRLSQRYRTELRMFRFLDRPAGECQTDKHWRLRYLISWEIPLLKSTEPDGWQLAAQIGDELLINLGTGDAHQVFDQNRLLLGLAFRASPALAFMLTWSNQLASTSSPDVLAHTDILWVGIRHSILQ